MSGLLHIYDASSNFLINASDEARKADHAVGVTGGVKGFIRAMDDLVSKGMTFDGAVISSHGNEGLIAFDSQVITADGWDTLAGRGYEKLFPRFVKIYFPGCRVAKGEAGWNFLAKAGTLFLRQAGGVTFAHDSYGFAVGSPYFRGLIALVSWTPMWHHFTTPLVWVGLKGKTVHHPFDTVKGYLIAPGGIPMQRLDLS